MLDFGVDRGSDAASLTSLGNNFCELKGRMHNSPVNHSPNYISPISLLYLECLSDNKIHNEMFIVQSFTACQI